MMDFFILGSGIAGSTIANLLAKKYDLEVFDKARGLGGRASNKRYKKNLSFDHGAQYISPKSKKFLNYIKKLHKKKVLKKWDGNHLDFLFNKKDQSSKFVGTRANNDISKYNLKNIKQSFISEVIKIERNKKIWEITLKNEKKYQSKGLILSCPYPQLKNIAKKYLDKKLTNLKVKMQPNITVMIVIMNKRNIPISSVKFNDEILSWASNENSKKRFYSNLNLWTLQASLDWSKKTINLYKSNTSITNELISRFIKLTGFNKKDIIYKKTHGWKYSYSFYRSPFKSFWNKKNNLGICGDWFNGPKVEDAWQSSQDLFKKIKKNPL